MAPEVRSSKFTTALTRKPPLVSLSACQVVTDCAPANTMLPPTRSSSDVTDSTSSVGVVPLWATVEVARPVRLYVSG
ncbi:hypothetical protein D3C87_1464960 [compost metagenome]